MRVRAEFNELVGGEYTPERRDAFAGDVDDLGPWLAQMVRRHAPTADRGEDQGMGPYEPAFELNVNVELAPDES